MSAVEQSELGKQSQYADRYDPGLLFPIPRSENRQTIGVSQESLPFCGEDIWTSYEISWLELSGKPRVAIGTFWIPCDSPNIVESKSFKLYLNSFNQERFESLEAVQNVMASDLSERAGAAVRVQLNSLPDRAPISQPNGSSIDDYEAADFEYQPNANLLAIDASDTVEESLYSDLLRSNCPVTGQPDWGSVVVRYTGPRIQRESLLRYIVSYRTCQDFHEHCVERMFLDLLAQCRCTSLSVMARYTRRGGLDINPYRATKDCASSAPTERFIRQ